MKLSEKYRPRTLTDIVAIHRHFAARQKLPVGTTVSAAGFFRDFPAALRLSLPIPFRGGR